MTFRLLDTPIAPPPAVDAPPEPGGRVSALAPAFVPGPGSAALVERLQRPGALAVTTGQQPGLFGGPLYAVHKALSAAALARVLEEAWARPVVPVFWVAADDHDYAEVAWAAWLDEAGELVRHDLPPRPAGDPQLPMYRTPLGEAGPAAVAALAASLRGGDHRAAALAWAAAHWTAEATVGGAFAAAMAELLAPHGVLVLDPTHPAAKRAAAPVIRIALEQAGPLEAALVERTVELGRAGGDPGVPVGDGATLVMLEGSLGRDRLVRDHGALVLRRSGERFELPQLLDLLAAEPERFSANVLLRPVVERHLLPTVAYVAGPGELRYLPLTTPVYPAAGLASQVPFPRWSGLVVEPYIERVLDKFGATLEELMAPEGALERRVVRQELPPEVRGALDRLAAGITTEYGVLAHAAADLDPTLVRSLEGRRNRALWGVEQAEIRLVTHLRRRRLVELGQVERARTLVRPGGVPQERVLSLPTFLARHGLAWLEAVAQASRRHVEAALEGASRPT